MSQHRAHFGRPLLRDCHLKRRQLHRHIYSCSQVCPMEGDCRVWDMEGEHIFVISIGVFLKAFEVWMELR